MHRAFGLFLLFLMAACSTNVPVVQRTTTASPVPENFPSATTTSSPAITPTLSSTPQPFSPSITYGPDLDGFPSNVNPLTGREVQDPSLLGLPAVLVSISNMPFTARPQAGPGFAPWVYELYIGEGATRFMNVFYGQYPRSIPNILGGCEVRERILDPNGNWIGNRVWLDENANGQQDAWEAGVGGVCIQLIDATSRKILQETTTDANGYYAFDHPAGDVLLKFQISNSFQFTAQDVGNEDLDSDADHLGETKIFRPESTESFWDAGLILKNGVSPTPNPSATSTPWYIPDQDYVGPIRSGRLTYNQIGRMFLNSCLVYASAAWDIGEMLDACEIVYGVDKTTPNSALLPVTRLRELAEENLNPKQPVNYSGDVFSEEIPKGGEPANDIHMFYHAYTQSAWQYDPISATYLRRTDLADGTGTLIPAIDRLTGRQMAFENVIVLFAEHHRYRHNQLEIDFGMGQMEEAFLFRDGQAFRIYWSTGNREYEKKTGLVRPMHFVDKQGNPVALHPGRTWIHIVTPYSAVVDQGNGRWLVNFVQPYDPEDTSVP
jgi:hypothetical protein